MINPILQIGQIFESPEMLRKAIRECCCKNRVDITLPVNDRLRISAKCEAGCPWSIWASHDSRTNCFVIKRHNDEHTCGKKWQIKKFTSRFLSEKYIECFRADENMSLKNFSRIVQMDWSMTPSRSKLSRARRFAMKKIYGDEIGQYNLLWDYANEVRRSNPGSTFFLSVDNEGRFSKCYFSFDACKRGFLVGCGPLICLYGCHIKTKFGGQLVTAVGMDPNNCIYPVAFAVVEVEDTTSWTWFLNTLKQDLGIDNTSCWTIMSDKQKGLINAVSSSFPHSDHRFCVRHMWQNFTIANFRGDALKNQLWKIARRTTVDTWEEARKEMEAMNKKAFQWYILEARELPILTMIDRIKSQLMSRFYNKQQEAQSWHGSICPKIRKILAKNRELASTCFVSPAGDGTFEVQDRGRVYIVELNVNACTCRRWDLTGIPCSHAISCFRHERIPPETKVHSCYSTETFCKAYGPVIMPCKDRREWTTMNGCAIKPPLYSRKVGRPTRNRRKAVEEVPARQGGKRISRHGIVIICSHCGLAGHNKRGCNDFKAGLPPYEKEQEQNTRRKRATSSVQEEPETVITQEQEEAMEEPVITQEHNMEDAVPFGAQYEHTMLHSMMSQTPMPKVVNAQPSPLPDSSFIATAREALVKAGPGPSTATKEGNLALKVAAMKHAKVQVSAARNSATLEARYESHEKQVADILA
ncbi:uncharacterized protein LOC100821374 [Brachypodium distachyon]|uniref:uncharacterized protein LOC100821374 n=1 Tax=Brachypodium distachyon TaxID=15368 RepID=UPI00052FF8A3|nr:uncharacterized protein LOC100821374 [Brachypodium distachyon]|eukprot:XP_010239711.1 uncharacterized protein LOC100821374 [Brachypodium distachyon]